MWVNLPEKIRAGLDLVVLSPGVPTDLPIVNELRDEGLPIWGEIELAYQLQKGRSSCHYRNKRKDNNNRACLEKS